MEIRCVFVIMVSVLSTWQHVMPTVVVMDGDITIAGMFEVRLSSGGECDNINPASVLAMEATRWYLAQLNAANVLPFTLGFRGYSTCGNSGLAGKYATEILEKYRQSKTNTSSNDFIVGVVGPEYSSEAEVLSTIFKYQIEADRMLVISPSASAPSLNDKTLYPTFYRVIPDDTVQIQTMVKLMAALDWNRVAVIYPNDTYGGNGADALVALARENKTCVPKVFPIHIDSTRAISTDALSDILTTISFSSPKITGIVYIGDKHIANQLFIALQRLPFSDTPIVLLSESIELQRAVFHTASGSFLTKSKGTIVTSAPFTEITSFTSYWKSLVDNPTLLAEASMKNTYLSDITQAMMAELDERQPVYVKYSLVATHAMVKVIQQAYQHGCNNQQCQSVQDFKENFAPNDLVTEMNGINVSINSDFGVPLEPLSSDNYTLSFSEMTNAMIPESGSQYEVYNLQNNGSGATDNFQLIKVGELVHGALELDKDEIKDYSTAGEETSYPNVRRGECPVNYKCEDCLPVDFSEIHLHMPGDFYVIGIISNNNRGIPGPQGCGSVRKRHGYQMFLALKFAVDQVATSDNFTAVRNNFGNKTIGLIVLNDCNNALEIARKVLNLHYDGFLMVNGERVDLQNRILGYIGGQSTDVSQPAAEQLTKLGIVQISYSSTNPVLSDKTRYPYFMRIVTPDNVQANGMIDIVKALDGKYIQVVYSEGNYGEGGRDSVLEAAKENSICIAQTIEVVEDNDYFGYYQLLRRRPHAKLVIIFLRSHVASPFMEHLLRDMRRGEFQFIGSEAWGRNSEILGYESIQGSITFALEMKKNEGLDNYIKNQVPEKDDVNSRLEEYITARQNCYFPFSFDKTFDKQCTLDDLPLRDAQFESDPWCIFATNTILSFLEGSGKFFKEKCGLADQLCADYVDNPGGLVEEIKHVRMDIDGLGEIQLYDSLGDGSMGYKIFNIQAQKEDKSVRHYVEVGSYSNQSGLMFNKTLVQYPTDARIVSSCPNDQACTDCTEPVPTTTVPPPPVEPESTQGITYAFAILFGICLLAVLALVYILYGRRRKQTNETKEDPNSHYIHPTDDAGYSNPYHEPESFDMPTTFVADGPTPITTP